MAKIILGIDAGFSNMGITAMLLSKGKLKLINAAVLTTEKDERKKSIRVADDDIERLKKLTNDLTDFISETQSILYNKFESMHFRYFAAVEFPTGGAQGSRANRCMGMATGHLVPYLMLKNITFEIITPSQVKSIVKNKKTVSKDDVIKEVLKYVDKENICKINLSSDGRKKIVIISTPLYNDIIIQYSLFEHVADSLSAVRYSKNNSPYYNLLATGVQNVQ